MANPVFIAPHFDDVALSCGATVAMLAREASPLIVTVFAKNPDTVNDLSGFARCQHSRWKLDDLQVVENRTSEDECATRAMGERVRRLSLDFADAIYRDAYYQSDERLFGTIPDFDRDISAAIARELASIEASSFYVPLAIGNHVDHQLVFEAGRILAGQGLEVRAYEDLPYALNSPLPDVGKSQQTSQIVELDEEAFERKWSAISCYTSQLPVIFRDVETPRVQFERYAMQIGGGALAERFWNV